VPKPVTNSSQFSTGELVERTLSAEDPSVIGHMAALRYGLEYAVLHPLGTGLGSAVLRYGGETGGLHESAILAVFAELGVLGGLLYLAFYSAAIYYGYRAFRQTAGDPLLAGFSLVPLAGGLALLPITLTSGVWGNFSVTFLFWWCAGFSATLVSVAYTVQRASPSTAPTLPGEQQSAVRAV
jgi:hypothetical protein